MDAGTALAVVGLALQVLEGVKEYYKSWKDCDDDVKQFMDALQRVKAVLGHLHTTLKRPHLEDAIVSTIRDACDDMEEQMDEVKSMLRKFKKDGSPSTILQNLKKLGRRACYPFRKSTISRFMEIIEDMTDKLRLAIELLSLDTIASSQTQLQLLQNDISAIDLKIDDAQRVAEERRIWDSLSLPDYDTSHNLASAMRSPGSGSWFVDSEEFKTWFARPNSRLWLHGGAGLGKTVLCSSIIDSINKRIMSNGMEARLAYHYFSFDNDATHQIDTVVRSFLRQLLGNDMPSEIREMYSRSGRTNVSPHELKAMLTLLLQGNGDKSHEISLSTKARTREIFLVFDGLDELPSGSCRDSIFGLIHEMIEVGLSDHIHILMTSRYERDIALNFPVAQGWNRSCMNQVRIVSDIESYTTSQISNHAGLNSLPQETKEEIVHKLVSHSQGMFRWTALQMDHLKTLKIFRPSDIRKILNGLPRDLYGTYDRILGRLDLLYTKEAVTALQWLCFASRPMFVEEIAEASVIDPSHTNAVDHDRRISPNDVVEILSGLVTVQPGLLEDQTIPPKKHVLSIAHFSVREYLLADRKFSVRVSNLPLEAGLSHSMIVESCMAYIRHSHQMSTQTSATSSTLPLMPYACNFWVTHLASRRHSHQAIETVASLMQSTAICRHWIRNLNFHQPRDRDFYPLRGATAQFSAKSFQSFILFANAWQRNLSSICTVQYSAYYAISHGLVDLVDILLQGDFTPDFQADTPHGSLIRLAIITDNVDMVKVLSNRGASFESCLSLALDRNNENVIREILRRHCEETTERIPTASGCYNAEASGLLIHHRKTISITDLFHAMENCMREGSNSHRSWSHVKLGTEAAKCAPNVQLLMEPLWQKCVNISNVKDRWLYFNRLLTIATISNYDRTLDTLIESEGVFGVKPTLHMYDGLILVASRKGLHGCLIRLLLHTSRVGVKQSTIHLVVGHALSSTRSWNEHWLRWARHGDINPSSILYFVPSPMTEEFHKASKRIFVQLCKRARQAHATKLLDLLLQDFVTRRVGSQVSSTSHDARREGTAQFAWALSYISEYNRCDVAHASRYNNKYVIIQHLTRLASGPHAEGLKSAHISQFRSVVRDVCTTLAEKGVIFRFYSRSTSIYVASEVFRYALALMNLFPWFVRSSNHKSVRQNLQSVRSTLFALGQVCRIDWYLSSVQRRTRRRYRLEFNITTGDITLRMFRGTELVNLVVGPRLMSQLESGERSA